LNWQDNPLMAAYLVIFAAGFAGSFHCIGMCGGFACALGRAPQGGGATVVRHLLYNTGRLTTYCFLGALAGALGQVICTSQGTTVPLMSGPLDAGQRFLAVLAGLLMIAMALQFFGLLPRLHRVTSGFTASTLGGALRGLLTAPGPAAPLAFGVFNGFLPCPLVYAFAAQAASTAAPLPGVLTMAAFGLGTFPAMLIMGGVGRMLAPAWRQRGVWLAGSCILLLGLVTLGRGLLPFAAHIADSWHAGPAA
jgi:sulfite exporter TauE/SafE